MKVYSRECVLLLTIALCAKWSNAERERQTVDNVGVTRQPLQAKVLLSVIKEITAVTGKPLIVFDDKLDAINNGIIPLLKPYINSSCKATPIAKKGTATIKCELDNNIIMVHTIADELPRLYVSVTAGDPPPTNDVFCNAGEFLRTWLQQALSLKEHTSLQCSQCDKICGTKHEHGCLVCTICKIICTHLTDTLETPGDKDGQKAQPTDGDSLMPIIIASVVSFLSGVGVCLFVLCLIGHFHGRLCLKFTDSSKYIEKTAKNQDPKTQTYTDSTIDINEHDYHDLRCATLSTPVKSPKQHPEHITSAGRNPPNNAATEYETMSDAQKDHVYSGLRSRESNHSTEYEHTSPNRSSEHVYSGMLNDTQPSDPTTRQQPSPVNKSGETNIIDDRSMHDIGDNQVEPNNYFVLEKEHHSTNQPTPEAGQGTGGLSMVTHDSGENQMEPNDYFVLEKQQHSTNQPKLETVQEPNPGGAETADDTGDYHSYHTLQKI